MNTDINQASLISGYSCNNLRRYLHKRKTVDCYLADYFVVTGTDPKPGLHVSEIAGWGLKQLVVGRADWQKFACSLLSLEYKDRAEDPATALGKCMSEMFSDDLMTSSHCLFKI